MDYVELFLAVTVALASLVILVGIGSIGYSYKAKSE